MRFPKIMPKRHHPIQYVSLGFFFIPRQKDSSRNILKSRLLVSTYGPSKKVIFVHLDLFIIVNEFFAVGEQELHLRASFNVIPFSNAKHPFRPRFTPYIKDLPPIPNSS